ncbi:MAG: hypothetical protein GYA15_04775 [Leptolinea sp.]|nr:hypothetical protein [Leptolinea sp.]
MKKFLSANTFELIIVTIVLISSLYVVWAPANSLMNWYSTDDAFYYFKTAQNVSEGYGLTFDRIGRSSGFHPLWMLVCIPVFSLARFDLVLPLRVLVLVAGFFNAGTGILLYRMTKKVISQPAAVITALLWLLTPGIQGVTSRLGMESTISAFFIVFLLFKVSGYQPVEEGPWNERIRQVLPTGLIAVLTILSRLDNIFLVGMIGIWLVFRRSRLNALLLIDMAFCYLIPIAAAFWRLKPGGEYYQYSSSVYVVLAVSMLGKPILFELLGVYKARGEKSWLNLIWRVAAGILLADGFAFALLTGMTAGKFLAGYPRLVLVADLVISLVILIVVHLADRWVIQRESGRQMIGIGLRSWNHWLPEGIGYAMPVAVLMGAYFCFNYFYFGTPAPVSGQIKQWWGSLPNTVYGRPNQVWQGLLGFPENERGPWNPLLSIINTPIEEAAEKAGMTIYDNPYYNQMTMSWIMTGLAAVALVYLYRKKIIQTTGALAVPALFAGCLCQIASYMGTSYVNTRPWYWVQEMVLLVLCGGILFDAGLQVFSRMRVPKNIQQTIIVFISIFLFYFYVTDLVSFVPPIVDADNEYLYLAGVEALEDETPPGAIIGSTGGGVVAYFIHDRTIINLDGLMNSTYYFHLLKQGKANLYMDEVRMQYLHGNKYMITSSDPYMGLFKYRVEFIKDVWGSGLYRYIPNK